MDCVIGMPRSFPANPNPSNGGLANDRTNIGYESSSSHYGPQTSIKSAPQLQGPPPPSPSPSSSSSSSMGYNGSSNSRPPPPLVLCKAPSSNGSPVHSQVLPPSKQTQRPTAPNGSVYPNGSYELHSGDSETALQGYEYEEPEENFVSIDDAKIKNFLMKIGNKPESNKNHEENSTPTTTPPKSNSPLKTDEDDNTILTFEEDLGPKVRKPRTSMELTVRKAPVLLRRAVPLTTAAQNAQNAVNGQKPNSGLSNKVYLESREAFLNGRSIATHSALRKPETTNPNNGLGRTSDLSSKTNGNGNTVSSAAIPNKAKKVENPKIVANIDLLDSSDEEGIDEEPPFDDNVDEEDEDDFPLAAAAVSCELDLEEDDKDDSSARPPLKKPRLNDFDEEDDDVIEDVDDDDDDDDDEGVIELNSDEDDDTNYADYIEQEKGVELRWDDFREKQEFTSPPNDSLLTATNSSNSYNKDKDFQAHECHLCGKVVQSSYNLRRHMMIHTGERPFACDLCERRFREFSDLKKHRRRHINEVGYLCMICHESKPSTIDSTRCVNCDYKQIPPKFFADKYKSQLAANDLAAEAYCVAAAAQLENSKMNSLNSKPPSLTKKPSLTHNSGMKSPPSLLVAPKVSSIIPSKTYIPPPQSPPPSKRAATPPLPPLTPITKPPSLSSDAWLNQLNNMQAPKPSSSSLRASSSNSNSSSNAIDKQRDFPCSLCDRNFGTRHNLKRHFMIHTGEKPFSCPKCRKPFRESSTLRKHMVTHMRDRWYRCARCSETFYDYVEFTNHKQQHDYYDDDSEMYITNDLDSNGARTIRYENYDDEEDEDSNDDWLDCCECNQRFTDFDEYTEHIKLHDLSNSLFECYVCKRRFDSRETLSNHILVCKPE